MCSIKLKLICSLSTPASGELLVFILRYFFHRLLCLYFSSFFFLCVFYAQKQLDRERKAIGFVKISGTPKNDKIKKINAFNIQEGNFFNTFAMTYVGVKCLTRH